MKKIRIKAQLVVSIVFVIGIVFSVGSLSLWFSDSKQIEDEVDEINTVVKTTQVLNEETEEIINPPNNEDSPYWTYIKIPLIDVDLEKIKEINPDTKGWIKVEGTNINYPFVQSDDNSYYLTHSFRKNKNEAGWVFLDYRNDISSLGKNTIIYAHGRINSVLFGTLKNIINSNWYENENNHIIKLSSESSNTLWQVFSVYRIPTTSDYIVTNFENNQTFLNFLNFIKDRSAYDFNIDFTENDKVLTLSTCYTSSEKVVMHAKLIKIENK